MSEVKYWIGIAPTKCDITGLPVIDTFIDGATIHGPWGFMIPETHKTFGRGLGTGKGQRYEKQSDGRWIKTEG